MSRWRHSFYKLVPSWLSTDDGEKVLYSLGRLTDGFIERARRSLTARFPTYSGPTGLALLGDERGIIKGKGESLVGYARRLRGWRGPNGHQVRGNAFSMLFQIWNYFGGMTAREIDTGGNVYTIDRDGTKSATHGGLWNWDVTTTPVATAVHDAAAGSDVPDLLVGPGVSASLVLHCDGSPGRLIFLHIGAGALDANSTTVPAGDGWQLAATSEATVGTSAPCTSRLYWKIVGPYESFTSVAVACTNNSAGNMRFIGRAVNVTGDFPAAPLLEVVTATGDGALIVTPALAGQAVPALGLLFVQGRLTTYSAATGGWVELDAERTAGATGIGIDEQSVVVPTTGQGSGSITLGASSAVNMIAVTIAHKTPQDWYRFWLKLVPQSDQGVTANMTFGQAQAAGKTFGQAQAADETWGQQGITHADTEVVRNLFQGDHPWKLAGTKPEWLVLVLGEDETPVPNGTWHNWTYNGAASRPAAWRFWKL